MANLIYPQNEITQTFAQNGNKTILPETNAGTGRVSLNVGFPPETQKPLSQGGVAPNRQDFNGAFNLLYQWARLFQSGGTPNYSETLNYLPRCIVVHNNMLWWCLKANGPQSDNGVFTPGNHASYWQLFIEQLVEQSGQPEKVGGGFNRKLVITSSLRWQAPYTGNYKITCIGSGGGGGRSGGVGIAGSGGTAGGTTSFDNILSALGGSGGGGSGAYGGGGGGGAGKVTSTYTKLTGGDFYLITISAPGIGGSVLTSGRGTDGEAAVSTEYGSGANHGVGGGGAFGASNGGTDHTAKSGGSGIGGGGATNGSGYGGGGGGGGFQANDYGGAAGDGATRGTTIGGNGGVGAVIIEYYDESIG